MVFGLQLKNEVSQKNEVPNVTHKVIKTLLAVERDVGTRPNR